MRPTLLWINGSNNPPTPGQTAPYSQYWYDDSGQMIQRDRRRTSGGTRQVHRFKWDADGRLREVIRFGVNVFTATYDVDGERITKWDNATGSHTYSFGLYDSFQNTTHVPGWGQRKNGTDRFFHQDWIGSSRYLTDNTGNNNPAAMRFDAYGVRSAASGEANPTEFQFAGAWGCEREPWGGDDSGLDYLYQRYYDSLAGRFISRDPIGYAAGLNLYGYGDPVNTVDPLGLGPIVVRGGPNNFRGAVNRILADIERNSPTGRRMLREIRASRHAWYIAYTPYANMIRTGQSDPRVNDGRFLRPDGTRGPGCTIATFSDHKLWWPAETAGNQPRWRSGPAQILLHEMVHAWRSIRGEVPRTQRESEFDAVGWENLIKYELGGLPMRTGYSFDNVTVTTVPDWDRRIPGQPWRKPTVPQPDAKPYGGFRP